MMSKTLMLMAAVSGLAVAAPAMAQSVAASSNIQLRIQRAQAEIQAGVQSGAITRAEARSLREQLRQLRRTERQYSANGLSRSERQDLNSRLRNLRQQIAYAETYGGARYAQGERIDRNRDGWDDRDYDRDGRWDDNVYAQSTQVTQIDRDGDGWDDRDYDRDGRWDDDVQAQGGPYEPVDQCELRGGISGVIDSVIGRSTCLNVGERVTGSLSAVPSAYRNQFRDGGGYYYRYGSGRIYQIDVDTRLVTRVYDVQD